MNERSNDRFESLISAAVVDCVYQTADEFCAVDTSVVPDTSRLRKRVMRNLPGKKRTTVKMIVVAALAAALLALTACACLPEVRDYFWGVVTEWYGDHFEVSFEQETVPPEDLQSTAPEVELPTSIEQIAKLTYLPDGYYKANEFSVSAQYYAEYYCEEERVFSFSQCIYEATDSFVDGEDISSLHVFINEEKGLLSEEVIDDGTYYYLIWQDDQYRYSLYGLFSSITELLKIAENINFD